MMLAISSHTSFFLILASPNFCFTSSYNIVSSSVASVDHSRVDCDVVGRLSDLQLGDRMAPVRWLKVIAVGHSRQQVYQQYPLPLLSAIWFSSFFRLGQMFHKECDHDAVAGGNKQEKFLVFCSKKWDVDVYCCTNMTV